MKINDHFLNDDDSLSLDFKTPNLGAELNNNLPDTIVIHFTAGSSAESSAKHLCKASAKASAHVVVGRTGEIYQLAPFNRITWHAGKSSWKGRSGLNKYSIGIEIDNAGRLTKAEDGSFKTWFGKNIQASDTYFGTHRNETSPSYWHEYTEMQISRVFDLCELLIEKYPIREIVGHEQISPSRKADPGPAFPLDKLRDRYFGESRDSDGRDLILETEGLALVGANKLNIRSGPGVSYPTVSEPITRGQTVRILGSKYGWVEVEKVTKGWVSAKYLETIDS